MIWDVPPSCPAAQPVLPISHQLRQNQAEGGTAKINVNPTKVRQEMCYTVYCRFTAAALYIRAGHGRQAVREGEDQRGRGAEHDPSL